jgi:hypothetical protein
MEIPVGYAQANFFFGGVGLPSGAECTLGIDVQTEGDTPNLLAENLWDSWRDHILPNQSSDLNITGCTVKYGPQLTGPTGVFFQSAPGLLGSSAVPSNTAYLVSKTTAAGGRAGRGRMFVPGCQETEVSSSGTILLARQTAINTALETFRAELVSEGHPAVLLHGAGSPLFVPNPITGLECQSTVATQRRRLRR